MCFSWNLFRQLHSWRRVSCSGHLFLLFPVPACEFVLQAVLSCSAFDPFGFPIQQIWAGRLPRMPWEMQAVWAYFGIFDGTWLYLDAGVKFENYWKTESNLRTFWLRFRLVKASVKVLRFTTCSINIRTFGVHLRTVQTLNPLRRASRFKEGNYGKLDKTGPNDPIQAFAASI